MEKDDVRIYSGKLCTIILKNGFKYTGIIPDEIDDPFIFRDKYDCLNTINCGYIEMISEVRR